jgi:hypothetical protein
MFFGISRPPPPVNGLLIELKTGFDKPYSITIMITGFTVAKKRLLHFNKALAKHIRKHLQSIVLALGSYINEHKTKSRRARGGNYIMKNFIGFSSTTSLSAPVNLPLLLQPPQSGISALLLHSN